MTANAPYQRARLALIILAALFGIVLILSAGGVIKLVLLALLFAYILDPIVTALESRGLTRTTATLIFFCALFVCLGSLAALLVPVLVDQAVELRNGFTTPHGAQLLARIEQFIRGNFGFLGWENFSIAEGLHAARATVADAMVTFVLTDVVSVVLHAVVVPFIVFFLLKDGREIKKQAIALVPNRYFEFSLDLLYKMDVQMGNYLRSQFLDALIFGVLSTVALWLLGVQYFLVIGIFAGVANLVPFVGPVAGALPAVAVTLLDSGEPVKVAQVILAFVLLKLIDDVVVQPSVLSRGVKLHPLVVLLAIILGGQLFGILGMLLAVPCAGFVKVFTMESIVTLRKYRFS